MGDRRFLLTQAIKQDEKDKCSILLKFYHDEAGMIKNRFLVADVC